mmetsp:Transcript_44939/g.82063  ORF Transcript_44939/g.82063 Transcript_44939/m.82063 type:complete len:335 (+) Transcript_44939:427-1431(+)
MYQLIQRSRDGACLLILILIGERSLHQECHWTSGPLYLNAVPELLEGCDFSPSHIDNLISNFPSILGTLWSHPYHCGFLKLQSQRVFHGELSDVDFDDHLFSDWLFWRRLLDHRPSAILVHILHHVWIHSVDRLHNLKVEAAQIASVAKEARAEGTHAHQKHQPNKPTSRQLNFEAECTVLFSGWCSWSGCGRCCCDDPQDRQWLQQWRANSLIAISTTTVLILTPSADSVAHNRQVRRASGSTTMLQATAAPRVHLNVATMSIHALEDSIFTTVRNPWARIGVPWQIHSHTLSKAGQLQACAQPFVVSSGAHQIHELTHWLLTVLRDENILHT